MTPLSFDLKLSKLSNFMNSKNYNLNFSTKFDLFLTRFAGPVNAFKPDSGRADIKAWQKKVKETNRWVSNAVIFCLIFITFIPFSFYSFLLSCLQSFSLT